MANNGGLILTHTPTPRQVKEALWNGGIARSNKSKDKMTTPGLLKAEDLVRSRCFAIEMSEPVEALSSALMLWSELH